MEKYCDSPGDIAQNLAENVCTNKANLPLIRLVVLGLLGGAFIAFGGMMSTLILYDSMKYVGYGIGKFISGIVFSLGLILVIIGGAELFTGNNLIIMSLLDKRISLSKLLRNWVVVYFCNFIGALLMVLLYYYSGLWKTNDFSLGATIVSIANSKINISLGEAFCRGILCNWLVCLGVWLSFASRDITGKILAIIFPITAFVALSFEHCVANMYLIPIGIVLSKNQKVISSLNLSLNQLTNLNTYGFFVKNLIPVTVGNIIGGALFVGFLYWLVYLKKQGKLNLTSSKTV